MEWKTERLTARPLAEDELPDFLSIYLSNPFYLQLTEETKEGPNFDLSMLERDWESARQTPGRGMAGLWLSDPWSAGLAGGEPQRRISVAGPFDDSQ